MQRVNPVRALVGGEVVLVRCACQRLCIYPLISRACRGSLRAVNWGQPGEWSQGDFNDDGIVNAADASILAANWGYGESESTTVPEPSTTALLLAGLVALFMRRQPS